MEPTITTPAPQTPAAPPQPQPMASHPAQTSKLEYVGFGKRFLAFLIDGIILGVVSGGFSFTINSGGDTTTVSNGIGSLIGALYNIGLWTYWNGQTVGKKALGIKVVKEDGTPVDLVTAIIRYVGYIVSAIVLGLGFLWVLFDDKKQGWHDKIAKTVVVKA